MRGQRQPAIAPGIYPDPSGFEVRVKVKGRAYAKRFAPDTPLEKMQAWQLEERAYRLNCAIDDAALVETPVRGKLSGDVKFYLQKREGRPGYKADKSHLKAWVSVFGNEPRHRISAHRVQMQVGKWLQDGVAPKTLRHRVRVLRELWQALDGPKARTPVAGIKLPKVVKVIPTPVEDAIILRVAESLKAGLTTQRPCGPTRKVVPVHHPVPRETYARFLIRAISGQRPGAIALTQPEHIDREHRIWWVPALKGGNPVPFPLTDDLDTAFHYFDAVNAWGGFNTSSFAKTLRRHGWPAGVEPYRLRHSFAIAQLLAGIDLGDLQGLLGHTNPNTTRIYAPVLLSRLKDAVARGRRGLTPAMPAVPPPAGANGATQAVPPGGEKVRKTLNTSDRGKRRAKVSRPSAKSAEN